MGVSLLLDSSCRLLSSSKLNNLPPVLPPAPGTFKLTLEFTEEYPNKAPVVKFVSTMFHPNSECSSNGGSLATLIQLQHPLLCSTAAGQCRWVSDCTWLSLLDVYTPPQQHTAA
jgi:hypothetical protein